MHVGIKCNSRTVGCHLIDTFLSKIIYSKVTKGMVPLEQVFDKIIDSLLRPLVTVAIKLARIFNKNEPIFSKMCL